MREYVGCVQWVVTQTSITGTSLRQGPYVSNITYTKLGTTGLPSFWILEAQIVPPLLALDLQSLQADLKTMVTKRANNNVTVGPKPTSNNSSTVQPPQTEKKTGSGNEKS